MDFLTPLKTFFVQGQFLEADHFSYSENRGQALARLSGWSQFCVQNNLKNPGLSQLIACVGEVTNNSFDHNMGHWHDRPGCCVSWVYENNFIKFGIADRGRGIVHSLKPVITSSVDDSAILPMAFEKIISGRSPEQRGNGLKFVRAQVLSSPKNSLICISSGRTYKIGEPTPLDLPQQSFGTLTIIGWSLK